MLGYKVGDEFSKLRVIGEGGERIQRGKGKGSRIMAWLIYLFKWKTSIFL